MWVSWRTIYVFQLTLGRPWRRILWEFRHDWSSQTWPDLNEQEVPSMVYLVLSTPKPTVPNQTLHYLLQRPKHGQFHQILQTQEGLNLGYSSGKRQNWCDQEEFSPHCAIDWLNGRVILKVILAHQLDAPYFDSLIVRCRCEILTIASPSYIRDALCVSLKCVDELASSSIP